MTHDGMAFQLHNTSVSQRKEEGFGHRRSLQSIRRSRRRLVLCLFQLIMLYQDSNNSSLLCTMKVEQLSVLITDLVSSLSLFRVFTDYVGDELHKSWEKELKTSEKNGRNPSLLNAVFKTFGWEILFQGLILLVLELGCRCSQPFFLGGLVNFYSQPETINDDWSMAYWYSAGLILSNTINVASIHSQ